MRRLARGGGTDGERMRKDKDIDMAKKTKTSLRPNTKAYEEIKRHWGDVEVVDAPKDLRVFVQPEDVKSATRKDPGCCVFAQACKRQFAATKVVFWKAVAFVELPGPDGTRRVERFLLPPDMRYLIENFDRGNSVVDFAGFELKAPSASQTLAGQSEYKKRRKKTALVKGTRTSQKRGIQGEGTYSKPAIVVDLEVRNGSGRVHFKKEPVAV
jgi:hypothetical protein